MNRATLSLWVLPALLMLGCGDRGTPVSPSLTPVSAGPTITLSGVVTLSGPTSDDPCVGGHVSVDTSKGVFGAHTGQDGRYIVTGIPAGLSRITASYEGYEPVQRILQIDGDTVVNFELRPGR